MSYKRAHKEEKNDDRGNRKKEKHIPHISKSYQQSQGNKRRECISATPPPTNSHPKQERGCLRKREQRSPPSPHPTTSPTSESAGQSGQESQKRAQKEPGAQNISGCFTEFDHQRPLQAPAHILHPARPKKPAMVKILRLLALSRPRKRARDTTHPLPACRTPWHPPRKSQVSKSREQRHLPHPCRAHPSPKLERRCSLY